MVHRGLPGALLLVFLAAGCVPPGGPPTVAGPPPGAVVVQAGYPPPGARWTVRVTESEVLQGTTRDEAIAAGIVDFNGRRAYGLAGPAVTTVLDPATFNPIGTIVNGRVAVSDVPDTGRFSWPLWVGKAWTGTDAHWDRLHGAAWPPAGIEAHVAAYENVTVPAGTFPAFRIEYRGGIGSSVPDGGIRHPGSPGFETRETYWYAPGPKLIVRNDIVRLGTHYQWAGRTTTELLSVPR